MTTSHCVIIQRRWCLEKMQELGSTCAGNRVNAKAVCMKPLAWQTQLRFQWTCSQGQGWLQVAPLWCTSVCKQVYLNNSVFSKKFLGKQRKWNRVGT